MPSFFSGKHVYLKVHKTLELSGKIQRPFKIEEWYRRTRFLNLEVEVVFKDFIKILGVWKEYGIYVYYKKVGPRFCFDSIKQLFTMK